jgi:hypothetical protein
MRAWKWIIASGVLSAFVIAMAFEAPRGQIRLSPSPGFKPNQPSRLALKHVLLPASETAAYARYYLAIPGLPVGSWQPDQADMDSLEAALPQISGMNRPSPDPRHIDNLGRYFLQYLPIVQRGRKRIFVNAFCYPPRGVDWRSRLYVVIDGGDCYWQAYYDPAIGKFSNLMINGRA